MENFDLERKLEELNGRRREIEQREREAILRVSMDAEKRKTEIHNVAQEQKMELAIEKDAICVEYREWKKRYLAELAEQEGKE